MAAESAVPLDTILSLRAVGLSVDRSRLSSRVADIVARAILEEGLQPGDWLPSQRQMVEQFGIGRASVREALRLLEADGLVRMKMGPSGGPEVAHPRIDQVTRILALFLITSRATVRDVYTARAATDPETARLAAMNASGEDRAEVAATLERMRANMEDGQQFLEDDLFFHRLLARICGNPMLTAISLSILSIIDRHGAGVSFTADIRVAVLKLHEGIARAVVDGDGDAAAAAAAEHVEVAIGSLERQSLKAFNAPLSATDFVSYSG